MTAEARVIAAQIRAAQREVDNAIAVLAASPLDEAAADRMREVLSSPRLRRARRALSQNPPPKRPQLRVITSDPTNQASTEEPGRTAAGGAA